MRLDFEDYGHRYTLVNEDGLPRIIDSYSRVSDIQSAPALSQWEKKQIARYAVEHLDAITLLPKEDAYELILKSVYWNVTRAGNKGRDGHTQIEATLRDGKDPEGFAVPALNFLTDNNITILPSEVERRLCHPELGYAGTADIYQPTQRVIDWKTKPDPSKNLYPNQAMQLVAYANASHIADIDTGELAPITTKPTEGIMVAVYPDDTWKAWHIDLTLDFWHEAWRGMLDLHRYQKDITKGWKRI